MFRFWLLALSQGVLRWHGSGARTARSGEVDDVLAWAESAGIDVGMITAQEFDKGGIKVRGLAAKKDIAPGDEVARVPYGRILSSAQPQPSSFAKSDACSGVWKIASGQEKLTLQLLHRRYAKDLSKDERTARDYLALLPTRDQYQGFHPLAADPSAFAGFEALPVVKRVNTFRATEKKFHNELAKNKCLNFDLSLEDYMWMFTAQRSRTYGAECKDGSKCSLMAPVVDMSNTVPGGLGNTHWGFNADRSAFVIKATRKIKKGEEITETYKDKGTDEDTYRIWGFTSPTNPYPVEQLPKDQCEQMIPAAKKYLNGELSGCRDKVGGVECNLATLAKEHCTAYLK